MTHSLKTAILTGPQGCGKSMRALELARELGCSRVVDEWRPGDQLVEGALHVTHREVGGDVFEGVHVVRMATGTPEQEPANA